MPEQLTTRMRDDLRLRALMVAYQGGSVEAFDELHAVLSPLLGGWLRARTSDAAQAEDLAQETFLQIHRARRTYDPAYPVLPWAYAIARHVWLMDRRARLRRPRATDTAEAWTMVVRGEAESYVERREVRNALAGLPESRRTALVWHHIFGWSFRAIAARLGIRESAAKLRSSRGMADLRARLGGARDDDDGE